MAVFLLNLALQLLLRARIGNLFLTLMTSSVLSSCSTSKNFLKEPGYYSIRFQRIGSSIPIVKARLNDKVAWFIMDTGASITLLNQAESKYFGFGKRNYLSNTETEINGLGGSITIIETSFCTIEIGHLIIKHYGLKSRDMSKLFSVIKKQ